MGIVRRLCSSWNNLFQVVRSGNRNSYSFFNKSVDPSCSNSFLTHGIHVFQCPDAVGIVAKLSDCIASRGGNILSADVFVPQNKRVFYSRNVFVFDPVMWPRMQMEEDFLRISKTFNSMRSVIRVPALDPKYKIAILASKQDGRLSVDITCVIRWNFKNYIAKLIYVSLIYLFIYNYFQSLVIGLLDAFNSNHYRGPENEVIRFLEMHGVPYHYLKTTTENKREEEILKLVQDTDFLVLARYMRILSSFFLRSYGKDIINIHHGLLPSFSGSNPSKQAVDAGVKLIGATSHFVTEGLDAGPIIEQMVERVSHRDNLQSFVQKSENLEKQCLTSAIRSYCELRVLPYEEKNTVVF